jgi:hypothetical protein
MSSMYGLQHLAEANGCLASSLVIRSLGWPRGSTAGWLARIWEASESPKILPADYNMTVEQSHRDMSEMSLSLL